MAKMTSKMVLVKRASQKHYCQLVALQKQSQKGTKPAKKRVLKKNYRMYYVAGVAGERRLNMASRQEEFSAINRASARKWAISHLAELADRIAYSYYLTGLEEYKVVFMKCPTCHGIKKISVTTYPQTGKFTRWQTCPGCNGSGKIPGFQAWKNTE